MLVRVTRNGVTRSVLFDAGGSPDGLTHNLDSLGLSPKDWSCIVLSHGHYDHVLGLVGLQKRVKRLDFPLTLHPEYASWILDQPDKSPQLAPFARGSDMDLNS
jgi:7,8-dihydropterin-6-yl-methyl-4-(beta-D-ribofuranosyl)aminobenzene 5'-phosphate synthase